MTDKELLQQVEPVMYQERTDLRGPYSSFQGWTDWRECDKEQYEMIKDHPTIYYTAQSRALTVAAIAQPADSTPKLHVGESSFEDWYQAYARQGISKQVARDAYAAGMGDPLVTYAQPVQSSQALQTIARLLQVHEGRNPEDALKIAAGMIGAQPVQRLISEKEQTRITAEDFGVPVQWAAYAENYANWKAAQPAQPAADALDAARYRWLRDNENGNCAVNGELLSGEKLDRAVDKLTKETK